jgi:hypothetical protein
MLLRSQAAGGFGAPAQSAPAFGGLGNAPSFGGALPASPSPFGATTSSGFGAPQSAASFGGFGAASTPAFGAAAPAANPFAAPAPAFGAPAASGFGAPAAASPFGERRSACHLRQQPHSPLPSTCQATPDRHTPNPPLVPRHHHRRSRARGRSLWRARGRRTIALWRAGHSDPGLWRLWRAARGRRHGRHSQRGVQQVARQRHARGLAARLPGVHLGHATVQPGPGQEPGGAALGGL